MFLFYPNDDCHAKLYWNSSQVSDFCKHGSNDWKYFGVLAFFLIVISLCTNDAVNTCCDQKFSVKWEILLTSQKMDSVIQVGKYLPIH